MRAHADSSRRLIGTLSELLRCVDSENFPAELARQLREITALDRVVLYAVRREEAPLMLRTEASEGPRAKRTERLYLGGGYRYDPYYRAFIAGKPGGFCMGASEEGNTERWERVQHVAYLSPVSRDVAVVALLVRTPGSRVFSAGELRELRSLEEPLISALRLHWTTWAAQHSVKRGGDTRALHRQVERAIDEFGHEVMTPREREVVRLLLRGHTTKAAAERLGIAVATTALHRKRAYGKLGVCSQAELFYRFLCSIAATAEAPAISRPRAAGAPAPLGSQADWPLVAAGAS